MTQQKYAIAALMAVSIAALLVACGGGGGVPAAAPASAQLAVGTFTKQSGTTVNGNNIYPIASPTMDVKTQHLYYASEVGGSGKITKIRLQLGGANAVAVTCPNVTVTMGQTNLTALTTSFAGNVNTGQGSQVTVLNNAAITIPIGAANSWVDIPLTTPFDYNGVDNLVVGFESTTKCTGQVFFNIFNAATNRRAVATATDTVAGVAEYNSTTASVDVTQNLMQFVFAGGDDVALAADRSGANLNTIAPASTGRSQFLILASDINGSGPITGIQFKPSAALAGAATATYKITLSHVPAATTALASTTFASNVGTNPTVVANGVSVTLPVGTTEWWVPLTGSFNYDGTSNLLIDVEATVTAGPFAVAYQNAGGSRIMTAPTTSATTGLIYTRTLEPKLRFNGGQVVVAAAGIIGSSGQPLGGQSPGGQMQSLYTNDVLGTSGSINNVYVRLSTASVATSLTNYKLYMGHTTKQTLLITDSYASNMNENATVMSGTLTIPAGLQAGDWVKIPLSTPFTYDSTKNLSILFTTDVGSANNNMVSTSIAGSSVGRNDNAVTSSGVPTWSYSSILDLKLDISK